MAYTIDDIKQLALEKLGFEELDFSEVEEKITIRINKDYPLVKNTLLKSYKWRFATKTEKLADPVEKTDFKYKYEYTLPTDFKRKLGLYKDAERNCPIVDFELQEGKLYTNAEDVYCKFIYDISEDFMDEDFVQLLSHDIAIHHCFDFTGDTQLKQSLFSERTLLFKTAKNTDFSQKKVSVQKRYPYISVRG